MSARTRARHAKPSTAKPALAAVGLAASFAAVDVAAASAASAATADDFARLRQCESGGNYRINTGNGFYGAYQFDRGTWNGLGYPGTANQASPATQDEAARRLQAARGWSPWPACSRSLGLGSDRTVDRASRSSARSALPAPTAARPSRTLAQPTTPPVFIGRPLSLADRSHFRIGARMWQARMAQRGWRISVDGYFGPQSARIARQFAAEHGLRSAALPGEVDRVVWNAAWERPVS